MSIQIRQINNNYEFTLKINGLSENNITVHVNYDQILFEGDYSYIVEEKDINGKPIFKDKKERVISKKFPIPESLDWKKAKILNKKDMIIVTIPQWNKTAAEAAL